MWSGEWRPSPRLESCGSGSLQSSLKQPQQQQRHKEEEEEEERRRLEESSLAQSVESVTQSGFWPLQEGRKPLRRNPPWITDEEDGSRMSAVVKSAAGVVLEGGATTKTKRFKVKHPKRKLFRASEPLLSVFMWGVNHTVSWREMRAIGTKLILSLIGGGVPRAPPP